MPEPSSHDPGQPPTANVATTADTARHVDQQDIDIAWSRLDATPITRWRMLSTAAAWTVTVLAQIPTFGTESTVIAGVDKLAFAALAGLLLGFLYFLHSWASESLNSQTANPLLVCWMSVLCSVSVCLTGVIAFGVQACITAASIAPHGLVGTLGWLIPLAFVVLVATALCFMLVGLLRWYATWLAVVSHVPATAVTGAALTAAWLLPWRWFFNRGIVVLIGMGLVSTCWVASPDPARLIAALGLILSLLFGLFGVGAYAAWLGNYLPRIRAWYIGDERTL